MSRNRTTVKKIIETPKLPKQLVKHPKFTLFERSMNQSSTSNLLYFTQFQMKRSWHKYCK